MQRNSEKQAWEIISVVHKMNTIYLRENSLKRVWINISEEYCLK